MGENKIDVNALKNKEKRIIYKHLWANQNFDFNIIKKGVSDPSYEFEFADKDSASFVSESLSNNFGIEKEKYLFIEKFGMSCSGTGGELKKITTLHSSSLCALLFFFNVDTMPLKIRGLESCEFTQSFFEFKNKVIRYPSNIDVVLLGKNKKTNKKVILFLESKFSEYITGINKKDTEYKIGKAYLKEGCFSKPIYDELNSRGCLQYNEKNGSFTASKPKYIEGLKQIVSHYYGIRNFLISDYYEKDNRNLDAVKEYGAEEFILGEIVFDNFGKELADALKSYEEDYEQLAEIINNQCKKDKIGNLRVLPESLKYSDLKDYISEFPKIKNFYFGKQL
jgi:hypothetical protein